MSGRAWLGKRCKSTILFWCLLKSWTISCCIFLGMPAFCVLSCSFCRAFSNLLYSLSFHSHHLWGQKSSFLGVETVIFRGVNGHWKAWKPSLWKWKQCCWRREFRSFRFEGAVCVCQKQWICAESCNFVRNFRCFSMDSIQDSISSGFSGFSDVGYSDKTIGGFYKLAWDGFLTIVPKFFEFHEGA